MADNVTVHMHDPVCVFMSGGVTEDGRRVISAVACMAPGKDLPRLKRD